MKDVFNNKYLLLIIGILIFVGSVMIGMSVLSEEEEKGIPKKEVKNYQYKMYVKSSSIIKFIFETSYDECTDSHGKKYACGNYSDKIINHEIFDQENNLFSNINFNGKTVIEALSTIVEVANTNNIEDKSLKIITNDEFSYKEITDELKSQFNLGDDFKIIGITRKEFKEEDVIKELNEEKELITFKVIFNSDGGSLVTEQEIVENELVIQPVVPEKDGFIFVEWQLNGTKFDFNTPIVSDITLTAIWKEEEKNKEQITTTIPTTTSVQENIKPTASTTTKKTTKPISTINNINLNDEIIVHIENINSKCGYYYFSKGQDDDGNIIYDEEKEREVQTKINNIINKLPTGVKDFKYSFNDHQLLVDYKALVINNKYNYDTLYNSWKKDLKRLTDIFGDASFANSGSCNSQNKSIQLNETICSEYNLKCSRW